MDDEAMSDDDVERSVLASECMRVACRASPQAKAAALAMWTRGATMRDMSSACRAAGLARWSAMHSRRSQPWSAARVSSAMSAAWRGTRGVSQRRGECALSTQLQSRDRREEVDAMDDESSDFITATPPQRVRPFVKNPGKTEKGSAHRRPRGPKHYDPLPTTHPRVQLWYAGFGVGAGRAAGRAVGVSENLGRRWLSGAKVTVDDLEALCAAWPRSMHRRVYIAAREVARG